MKRIFLAFVMIIIASAISRACFADPLWYGEILSVSNGSVTLVFRGLEEKNYVTCDIATVKCVVLPTAPASVPLNSVADDSFSAFPKGSTHRNSSPNGNFGFSITALPAKSSRILAIASRNPRVTYKITDTMKFWNLLDLQPRVSRFSLDNLTMAYVDDRSGFASLYLVNLKNLSLKKLQGVKITSGVSVGDFRYADAHTIMYVANTASNPYDWVLYSYDIDTQASSAVAHNLVYDTTLYQSGNSILFTEVGSLGTIPEVLTDFHGTHVVELKPPFKTPQSKNPITYTYQKIAGFDTVVMSDRDSPATKHPLIVWLHGGPYRQTSFIRHAYISYGVYDWAIEQAVDQGAYAVKIDYPGSYGSGRTLTEDIKGGVGSADVNAVEKVISDFVAHNPVDGVYVMGNSYGGYLALRTAVAYPEQIDGALSINGVTDWASLITYYKSSIFNEFFGGIPSSKNKKIFAQASILSQISNLKNPVYIIQGEADTTIPKSQAILLKNGLDKARKNSTLIMIPAENHVFLKDSSIDTVCKTLFEMTGIANAGSQCDLKG